jgi:proton-coupled amino acid transporter
MSEPSVFNNLGFDALSLQVVLCLTLLQTYAIQFYPAVKIVEEALHPWVNLNIPHPHHLAFFNAIRAVLVAITVGLAAAIPHIGLFISLIGSLGSGALALIFPPLIHFYSMRDVLSVQRRYLDIALASFGVIGSVAGTYVSIKAIVDEMS